VTLGGIGGSTFSNQKWRRCRGTVPVTAVLCTVDGLGADFSFKCSISQFFSIPNSFQNTPKPQNPFEHNFSSSSSLSLLTTKIIKVIILQLDFASILLFSSFLSLESKNCCRNLHVPYMHTRCLMKCLGENFWRLLA